MSVLGKQDILVFRKDGVQVFTRDNPFCNSILRRDRRFEQREDAFDTLRELRAEIAETFVEHPICLK